MHEVSKATSARCQLPSLGPALSVEALGQGQLSTCHRDRCGPLSRSLKEDVPNRTIAPCLALPIPGSPNPIGSLRGYPPFPTSGVHGLKWENALLPAVWSSGDSLSPTNLSAPSPKRTQQLASTLLVHCNNTEEGKNHP